jgi:hypothetical protein
VIVAERLADGLATLGELEEAGLPPSQEDPGRLDYLLDPDAINAAYGVANGLATWAELQERQRVRSERRADYGPEEVRAAGERAGQAVAGGKLTGCVTSWATRSGPSPLLPPG